MTQIIVSTSTFYITTAKRNRQIICVDAMLEHESDNLYNKNYKKVIYSF